MSEKRCDLFKATETPLLGSTPKLPVHHCSRTHFRLAGAHGTAEVEVTASCVSVYPRKASHTDGGDSPSLRVMFLDPKLTPGNCK